MFEYNEAFLIAIVEAAYSGFYGTFLCDSIQDLLNHNVAANTNSVWDTLLNLDEYANTDYDPHAMEGMLLPKVCASIV